MDATRRAIRAGRVAAALAIAWYDCLGVSLPRAWAASATCEPFLQRAAAAHGIPLQILYSVGLTETGRGGQLSPYDMNVDGRPVHSGTISEALARYAIESRRGARFIDIGCMQINHHYHAANFRSLVDMFDPEQNVQYAANLLKILKAQEGSWTMAVARYNAGPGNPRAQRIYVCAVIGNMVASGQGNWTPNAQAFCR